MRRLHEISMACAREYRRAVMALWYDLVEVVYNARQVWGRQHGTEEFLLTARYRQKTRRWQTNRSLWAQHPPISPTSYDEKGLAPHFQNSHGCFASSNDPQSPQDQLLLMPGPEMWKYAIIPDYDTDQRWTL